MTLTPNQWLRALATTDQIVDFLARKGSIIKFCVTESEGAHRELERELALFQTEHQLGLVTVASNLEDVSRPENVVKQVARSFRTGEHVTAFAQQVWVASGFPNDELAPLSRVAKINGIELGVLQPLVYKTMQRLLPTSSEDGHVPAFNRDFRNALLRITREILDDGPRSPIGRQLIAGFDWWIDGVAPAHVLKLLGIQWKLKRTNATQVMRSVLALPALTGVQGSILHLDFRTVTNPEMATSTTQTRYTKRTRTNVFQWLRELIDQTYMFDSSLIIVEVGPSFMDQSATGPGVGSYDALKFRVLDDVTTDRDNPSSVITRIASSDLI